MKRFLKEAQSAARLKHPNIVSVFDSGVSKSGQPFIASEFIEGRTLNAECSARGYQSDSEKYVRDVVTWARDLAAALHYSHQQGIVHRDLKPENIIISEDRPQLMDFGLAKDIEAINSMETQDGTILGTPAYMSPEQARGDVSSLGPSSDQFSLGVVLFEALEGERPLQGHPHQLLLQLSTDEELPRLKEQTAITRDLVAIVEKATRKSQEDRYGSCEDLASDLSRWLNQEAVQARPISSVEKWIRWTKRNPVVASLTILVFLVTSVGLVTTSTALWSAMAARKRAEKASTDLAASLEVVTAEREYALSQERRAEKTANELAVSLAKTEEQQKLAESEKQRAESEKQRAEAEAKRAKEEEKRARIAAEELKEALERITEEQARTVAEKSRADGAEETIATIPAGVRLRLAQGIAGSENESDRDFARRLLMYATREERDWAWSFMNEAMNRAVAKPGEDPYQVVGHAEQDFVSIMDDPNSGSPRPRKIRVAAIGACIFGDNVLVGVSPNGIVWSVDLLAEVPKRKQVASIGSVEGVQFDPMRKEMMAFKRYTNQGGSIVEFFRLTPAGLRRESNPQPFPLSTHDLHSELGLVAFQDGLRKISGEPVFEFQKTFDFRQAVRNFCFSESGDHLAVLTIGNAGQGKQAPCQVEVYETATMNVVSSFGLRADSATRLRFTPDEKWLFVSSGFFGSPRYTVGVPVAAPNPPERNMLSPPSAHVDSPHRLVSHQFLDHLTFTPDGRTFFAQRRSSTLAVYETTSGEWLMDIAYSKADFFSVGSNGRLVATVDNQGTVRCFDAGESYVPQVE